MISDSHQLVEQTFRAEYGRVLAALISQYGDFTLAEDAVQDALVTALEHWQTDGVPANPAAWITTIAKRRAVDRLRRRATAERRQGQLLTLIEAETSDENEDEDMESIPDERLKLMFTCCHPSLALDAQIALTLRTLGGLSTAEIARAFLVPVPTMAQRLARAKNKIRDAGIPYRIPPAHLIAERLDALLAVIYLIFNEGYTATSGDTLIRQELCTEATRLARVLVDLLPPTHISAESRGLLALMLLHDARRSARVNAAGELVLLDQQDRTLWDSDQIREGIAVLDDTLVMRHPGPYQIQAAISALHAEALTADQTDWMQIAALYRVLLEMTPSPVIEVNHAVAVAFAENPYKGLDLLLPLASDLRGYFPYHAARADLLRRTHQREAAADAYQTALDLCQNTLERAYLQRRLDELNIA